MYEYFFLSRPQASTVMNWSALDNLSDYMYAYIYLIK